MDLIHDRRTDCYSVLGKMEIGNYLELVRGAHAQRGGITGQREVLKTTTAKRIRDRMISDIRAGAVLPPVVIGVVVEEEVIEMVSAAEGLGQVEFLGEISQQELTIIDGMQRTAALIEACEIDTNILSREMRVEFWVARSVRSLVYRMLVLNTGQVPWTLARQLSVVYAPLLEEIKKKVINIERIFSPDSPGRRVASSQFSSDALVELYLAFSLRKTNVDTKETLSEEFSRLDFVDNLADVGFQDHFYRALSILVDIDKAFERFDNGNTGRFSRGKEVFGSQPARIGFMVAVAQYVLGRPGLDRSVTERGARMEKIVRNAALMVEMLNKCEPADVGMFLRLDVLSEILDKKVGQVGRYERSVFVEGFKVLIEDDFELPNMEPCWRAS
ncbi:hypothetical protein [Pseudomonas bubulae]|uniref:hypothetical protein n=1 Tax=Pseudomonas bubulae TaxID=2316085 RepID=UPI001C4EA42B|nr:hypothetical protein [Pseudomonas bubulae]